MKKHKPVLVAGLVLGLTIIGGILWHQNRTMGEAVPTDGYEAYLKVISTSDRKILKNVPEYIIHPASGERIPLRQRAQDFLDGTRGDAVDMLGFYLMEPRKGQAITSPVRVKLWHSTNHYRGGILRITDANGNTLAKLQLPEISHGNLTHQVYETKITFEQTATAGGFIVGHLWSTKDEYPDDYKKAAKKIPIVFNVSLVEVDIQWKTASELVITYTNKTERPFIYGPIHTLQKLSDNQWIDIFPKYPIAYHDVALILEPGSAFSETIDLTLYGDLEKGNYRIIKGMNEDRMDELTGRLSEDRLQVEIVAEFQIFN